MKAGKAIIPVERIARSILLIRGQKVMLDVDLAELYGVPTKRLNEQVKRNRRRFPADFMFQLSAGEKAEVVAICDHLQKLKFSPTLPYAFTEHGAIMLASVLNTQRAIEASLYVVRVFVELRNMLATHKKLAQKISELEAKLEEHDAQIGSLVEAIRQLMLPPKSKSRRIGFLVSERVLRYGHG
ncbi:MAG: ORF6N domain-containing protein [Deltaproteobacteria bacterium]|nr:ORF6N domain-containing protein [Deltaproteobacteria bacterium]